MTRRQAKAGNWNDQWIDKQVLPVVECFLVIEKTKNITAAKCCRPKHMHSPRIAEDRIGPCHSFIPAQAKEILQNHHIAGSADAQVASLKSQRSRNAIFNLKPWERQEF